MTIDAVGDPTPSGSGMRFTFDTSIDETIRALAATVKVTSKGNRSALALTAVLLAVLAGTAVVRINLIIPVALALYAALVLTWMASRLEQRWRTRRDLESDPHTVDEHTFEAREDGLTVGCKHLRSELSWSAIRSVVETDEFYLFFCGAYAAQYLPKRVVLAAHSNDRLKELVRRCSPDRGTGLQP